MERRLNLTANHKAKITKQKIENICYVSTPTGTIAQDWVPSSFRKKKSEKKMCIFADGARRRGRRSAAAGAEPEPVGGGDAVVKYEPEGGGDGARRRPETRRSGRSQWAAR